MFDFIRSHQMNIMLCLCAVCATMTIMLFLTKFLSTRRKWILICMEVVATLLLFFDRMAYIYAGNPESIGYIMVRLSNFMVFFLTSATIFVFNFYIIDLLQNEGQLTKIPRRLIFTGFTAFAGMMLAIVSAFTHFYYYFDYMNFYHRGNGFLIAYLIPVICPLVQYSAIIKYRKSFSKFIFTAVALYVFLPIVTGIIQIFAYGISIVNMTMVLVSVFLYFFSYLDVNAAVEKAHEIEIQSFKTEQSKMKSIFGQAAQAMASVLEKNNKAQKGRVERLALTAKELARRSGKSEDECDKVYYAACCFDAGEDALSFIKAFPYLSETAQFVGKDYDESQPEYSRIITLAKDYDKMINDPTIPPFYVRDYLIREAGRKYDPFYAKIAVQLLDSETNKGTFERADEEIKTELVCHKYREEVSAGIPVVQNLAKISFESSSLENDDKFSIPSIVLFDSSDERVQKTQKTIESHKYIEYGEVWFDGHFISTSARNMEVRNVTESQDKASRIYTITASRFEDHVLLKMQGPVKNFDVIIALPSASKSAFIGITGENVNISKIRVEHTSQLTGENDIPRIAEKLNYINRIESDIPNVQIVKPLAVFTQGVEVKNGMKIYFHAQSLPDANLVWHCPYILLYYSEDGKVYGKDYCEYAMVKFDGEENGSNENAENDFVMKKTKNFSSWEDWEELNKAGYECQIEFMKNGSEVMLRTQNKGIFIQNTTRIRNGNKEVYVAFSGDQVALTDIRIR